MAEYKVRPAFQVHRHRWIITLTLDQSFADELCKAVACCTDEDIKAFTRALKSRSSAMYAQIVGDEQAPSEFDLRLFKQTWNCSCNELFAWALLDALVDNEEANLDKNQKVPDYLWSFRENLENRLNSKISQ